MHVQQNSSKPRETALAPGAPNVAPPSWFELLAALSLRQTELSLKCHPYDIIRSELSGKTGIRMTSPLRRQSTATELLHPMFVMSVQNFLEMDVTKQYGGVVPCHQQLLSAGLLVEWSSFRHQGSVAFVSHQWTSWHHADPQWEQLSVLQRVLERIKLREITTIEVDFFTQFVFSDAQPESLSMESLREWIADGYLWFDYFSMPQTVSWDAEANDSLKDAVNSIPGYIELCEHFIVLCPPVEHKDKIEGSFNAVNDFASWSRRGWCRAELSARALSRRTGPLIKISSAEGSPSLFGPRNCWFSDAGRGEFTCCERHHRFVRTNAKTGATETVQLECDRPKVAFFMRQLLAKKVDTLRARLASHPHGSEHARNLLSELRWVQSIAAHLLSGLRVGSCGAESHAVEDMSYQDFMATYMFDPAEVNGTALDHKSGWTPLRYAAISRASTAVRELVRRGADVEAPLSMSGRAHAKGMTILQSAAQFGTASVVRLLLQAGADTRVGSSASTRAPNSLAGLCAKTENVDVLRELLAYDPSLAEERDSSGCSPALCAAISSNGEHSGAVFHEILHRVGGSNCQSSVSNAGADVLMYACAAERADGRVVDSLINDPRWSVDVNRQTRLTDFALRNVVGFVASGIKRGLNRALGRRSSPRTSFVSTLSPGQTALMKAARMGSVPFARSLLAAGACPLLKDCFGRTARDIAAEFGPFPPLERILKDAEDAAVARGSCTGQGATLCRRPHRHPPHRPTPAAVAFSVSRKLIRKSGRRLKFW